MNRLSNCKLCRRTNTQDKSRSTSSASSQQPNVSVHANTPKKQPPLSLLPSPSGYGSKSSAASQKSATSSLSPPRSTKGSAKESSKASSSHQSVFEKHQPQRTLSVPNITRERMTPSYRSYSYPDRPFLDIPRLPSRTDSEIIAGMHKYTNWREYRKALDNYESRQEERSLALQNHEITVEEYQLFSDCDQKPTYVGHARIDEEAAFRRTFGF